MIPAEKIKSLSLIAKSKRFVYLKIIFSLSILFYFVYNINYNELIYFIKSISPAFILILIILTILRNIIGGARFHLLIKPLKTIPIWQLSKHYFIASYYNNFLPTAIGGDAIRVYYTSQYDIPIAASSIYILIERLTGLYALVVISFISAFFWKAPASFMHISTLLLCCFTVLILIIFILRSSKLIHIKYFSKFRVFSEKSYAKNIFYCFLISLIFQIISVFISFFVGFELNLEIPFIMYLTIVPLIWIITMIPISFGGLGLREASFVALFKQIGVEFEAALLISLGTYMSLLLSSFIGFYYSIGSRKYGKI